MPASGVLLLVATFVSVRGGTCGYASLSVTLGGFLKVGDFTLSTNFCQAVSAFIDMVCISMSDHQPHQSTQLATPGHIRHGIRPGREWRYRVILQRQLVRHTVARRLQRPAMLCILSANRNSIHPAGRQHFCVGLSASLCRRLVVSTSRLSRLRDQHEHCVGLPRCRFRAVLAHLCASQLVSVPRW